MKPKSTILTLLANYERIYVENFVLRTMLSTANDPRVSETWEQTLQELSSLPMIADLHAKFAALRAQVSNELDAEGALELLRKMPIKGPVN
jgi:hypothetical protein